jgi:NitT/TauT family transport system permease protein
MNNFMKKTVITVIWIGVWQIVSLLVNNMFIIAGPAETAKALVRLTAEGKLFPSAAATCITIVCGYAAGAVLGILTAAGSYRWGLFSDLIQPLMKTIKAIPAVSFIILVIIWFPDSMAAAFVSMLVTFPVVFFRTFEGLESVDTKMTEMAFVFHMPVLNRIRYIYLPHLSSYLADALETAFSLSWTAGVAAEIIGRPIQTIGNGLYRGRITLATDEILAWTVAVVILSVVLQLVLKAVLSFVMPDEDFGEI